MKRQGAKPSLSIIKGKELSLSGPVLVEFLQSVLDKGVPFRFRATGFSMYPFIKDGDIITISPLSGSSPRIGDVAAFIHPETGNLVVHRIFGKKKGSFLIKGDNISYSDGLIPEANIMGCVTKVERKGERVCLGLGPERYLIALLTRKGRFYPLLLPLWKLVRPIIRWYRYE